MYKFYDGKIEPYILPHLYCYHLGYYYYYYYGVFILINRYLHIHCKLYSNVTTIDLWVNFGLDNVFTLKFRF